MVPSKIPPIVEPLPRGDTGRCWRCCDEEAKSGFCSHRVQRWEQISKQTNKIIYTQWVTRAMEKMKQEMRLVRDGMCRGPTVYLRKGDWGRSCSLRHFSPQPMILQPKVLN